MTAVDDVKSKIDIVDVIGQYAPLKKAGRNFKALCPFHNEKTPSFVVFPDQGTWHCFGACSTGGDVFTFLMKKENIDFGEALHRLAQRAGIELIQQAPGEDAERKRLREILATASAHYHYQLKSHPAAQGARDYLAKRFIKPETIAQFELGYALDEWEALKSILIGKEFPARELEMAGLIVPREGGGHYDRFRGRLMFPIRNRNSEVIGFGARTLKNEEPKYLNSPQTPVFDKSATLYGLDLAKDAIRSQNLAVIVEGYMDVIGAHQGGFSNVVASLGTALTQKQLDLLKHLTKRYALALDPDAAGEEATKRGLEVAREGLDRKTVPVPMGAGLIGFEERLEAELLVIAMPEGQDPDELIHDNPARWLELTRHPEPLVDFYFRVLIEDLDLTQPRDKSLAVRRLTPIVREVGDAIQRAHYTQRLARLVQVPEQTIAQEVAQKKRTVYAPARVPEQAAESRPRNISKREEYLLMLAIHSPAHLPRISFMEPEDFADGEMRAFYAALRETEQGATSERFDCEAFRLGLDGTLQSLFDRLCEQGMSLSELSEPELEREIELAAYRLRDEHDRAELAHIEVLLRDIDVYRTLEDTLVLHARVSYLQKRKGETQKALSMRTMFKSHAI